MTPVSSTVLQFDYRGYCVNLLDTPGHKDFSEDTYRVLTAVDAAVMVIDAGKGIESQTRKLFEVCRLRGIPIFTFMNKLDRPGGCHEVALRRKAGHRCRRPNGYPLCRAMVLRLFPGTKSRSDPGRAAVKRGTCRDKNSD